MTGNWSPRYQTDPLQAMQWTGDNTKDIVAWSNWTSTIWPINRTGDWMVKFSPDQVMVFTDEDFHLMFHPVP